jgi:hypothetical protein
VSVKNRFGIKFFSLALASRLFLSHFFPPIIPFIIVDVSLVYRLGKIFEIAEAFSVG